MPTRSIRTGPCLLATAVLLAGCSAEDKFQAVSPDLVPPSTATTAIPVTTATTLPALVPYAADGFKISLPGTPTVEKQTETTPSGPVDVSIVTVAGANNAYGVAYYVVAGNQFDLDGAARGAAAAVKGTLADVSPITYKGYAGRDFRVAQAQGGRVTVFTRVLRVKKRIFQVQGVFEGDLSAPPNDLYKQILESLVV